MKIQKIIFLSCLLNLAAGYAYAKDVVEEENVDAPLFFQIFDFREMNTKRGWASEIFHTPFPGEGWKNGWVYVFPGHSALAVEKEELAEVIQAEAAYARGEYVKMKLIERGYRNIKVIPKALELGSKAMVVYSKSSSLFNIDNILDEIRERYGSPEALAKSLLKDLEDKVARQGELIEVLGKRKIKVGGVSSCHCLSNDNGAIFGAGFQIQFPVNSSSLVKFTGGFGLKAEYKNEEADPDKALAFFAEAVLSLPFLQLKKSQMGFCFDLGILYEAERNKNWFATRDFVGAKIGPSWHYRGLIFEVYALMGTGRSIVTDYKFDFGGGISIGYEH